MGGGRPSQPLLHPCTAQASSGAPERLGQYVYFTDPEPDSACMRMSRARVIEPGRAETAAGAAASGGSGQQQQQPAAADGHWAPSRPPAGGDGEAQQGVEASGGGGQGAAPDGRCPPSRATVKGGGEARIGVEAGGGYGQGAAPDGHCPPFRASSVKGGGEAQEEQLEREQWASGQLGLEQLVLDSCTVHRHVEQVAAATGLPLGGCRGS